jgi:cell division transport system permease protein
MHLFYFREAARSFRHHRGLAYTAVFSLTAALALWSLLMLLSYNARVTLQSIGDRREMVVYLKDEVEPAQRQVLMGRLGDLYGTVTYVSREDAWKEFAQQIGDPSLLDAVEDNPLPASLRVKLKPELLTPDGMEQAARQIGQFPEVEEVRYGQEWVRRLDHVSSVLTRGTIAVGVVVALAILFIVYNTIRLTVLARRPQVEIMSRLGATDGFIAAPFVLEAMFEGALAAFLSLAICFGLQQGLSMRVIGLQFLPIHWLLVFVGATIGCSWIAAWLAFSRVVRAVGA